MNPRQSPTQGGVAPPTPPGPLSPRPAGRTLSSAPEADSGAGGEPQAPSPPDGLGGAGAALWEALCAAYEFEPAEVVVLASACRQADDIATLETLLATDGFVVAGSAGQPRLAAAVTEVRQGRLALARLLGELAIPIESAGDLRPLSAAGRRAQRAANARWAREDQKRARRGPA